MLAVEGRGSSTTVVAFSGLASKNHVYEWTRSFADLPVNFVGVQDPARRWWQSGTDEVLAELRARLNALGTARLIAVGGSAGGFGAIKLGRALGADRIIAFVPQTACGAAKRALGDLRWEEYCAGTPSDDLAALGSGVDVHYGDDVLDVLHAERLVGARLYRYAGADHDLPYAMRQEGRLFRILAEAAFQGARLFG